MAIGKENHGPAGMGGTNRPIAAQHPHGHRIPNVTIDRIQDRGHVVTARAVRTRAAPATAGKSHRIGAFWLEVVRVSREGGVSIARSHINPSRAFFRISRFYPDRCVDKGKIGFLTDHDGVGGAVGALRDANIVFEPQHATGGYRAMIGLRIRVGAGMINAIFGIALIDTEIGSATNANVACFSNYNRS